MRIIFLLSFILLSFINSECFAQETSKSDSLKLTILKAKNDSVKYQIYTELIWLTYADNPTESLIYIENLLDITKKNGWEKEAIEPNAIKALCYEALGQYSMSAEILLKNKKKAQELSEYDHEIYMNIRLMRIMATLGKIDMANEFSKEAIALLDEHKSCCYTETQYLTRKASIYASLGKIQHEVNNPDSAIYYYNLALNCIDWEIKTEELHILNYLGKNYSKIGLNQEALKYYNKMDSISRKENIKEGIINALLGKGQVYYKLNKLDSSLFFLESFIDISEQANDSSNIVLWIDAYKYLASVYANMDRFKEAYHASNKYINYYLSIQDKESIAKINLYQKQMIYENEQKSFVKEQQIRDYKIYLIISILSVMLLLLGFLFVLQRMKIIKQKFEKKETEAQNIILNQKVSLLNQELTSKVMYIIKENQMIEETKNNISQLKYSVKKEYHKMFDELINGLRKFEDKNTWDEFDNRLS